MTKAMFGREVRLLTHLRGGCVTGANDGNPLATPELCARGQTQQVVSPIEAGKQPASLLWFHDHGFGTTRLNVVAAAGYIVRDEFDTGADAPQSKTAPRNSLAMDVRCGISASKLPGAPHDASRQSPRTAKTGDSGDDQQLAMRLTQEELAAKRVGPASGTYEIEWGKKESRIVTDDNTIRRFYREFKRERRDSNPRPPA